jgi:hypothetical protein
MNFLKLILFALVIFWGTITLSQSNFGEIKFEGNYKIVSLSETTNSSKKVPYSLSITINLDKDSLYYKDENIYYSDLIINVEVINKVDFDIYVFTLNNNIDYHFLHYKETDNLIFYRKKEKVIEYFINQ